MEVILSTFNKFLLKNGVLDQEGLNYLNKQTAREINTISDENFEAVLINHLAEYLKNTYKDKPHSLSSSLYEKFIALDDEKIVKTIRKLSIIYHSKQRTLIQNKFQKWKLNSHKLKILNETLESEPIYRKKKYYDMPLIINEEKQKLRIKNLIPEKSSKINKSEEEKVQIMSTNDETIGKTKEEEPRQTKPKMYSTNTIAVNKVENFSIAKKRENIHEKLYEDRMRREFVQNKLAENYRLNEVKECTFAPKIQNTTSKSKSKKPFYIELYEDRKTRADRMKNLNIEKEKKMNSIYTFEPLVNTNYKLRTISSDFYERIKMYSSSKNKKIRQIKEDVEKNTPCPKSKRTGAASARKPLSLNKSQDNSIANIYVDKSERLMEYHRKKQNNIRKIERNMLVEQGVTFKPKLNESINVNINSSLLERNEDFVRNKSIRLKNITSKDDYECTFSPKINRNKIPLEDSNVGDRLYQYQNKYEKNKELKKEILKENYSFKPEINNNTYEILKQRDAIMDEIKSKYMSDGKPEEEKNNLPNDNEIKQTRKLINEIQENPEESESNLHASMSFSKDSEKDLDTKLLTTENLKTSQLTNSVVDARKIRKPNFVPQCRINKNIQNVSDSRLLELANQYITTDESLEQFQARLKEKYSKTAQDKQEYLKVVENNIQDKIKTNKIFNQAYSGENISNTSTGINNNNKNNRKPPVKNNKLAKNIKTALEYYDMLES